jgi:hypothetical protein
MKSVHQADALIPAIGEHALTVLIENTKLNQFCLTADIISEYRRLLQGPIMK